MDFNNIDACDLLRINEINLSKVTYNWEYQGGFYSIFENEDVKIYLGQKTELTPILIEIFNTNILDDKHPLKKIIKGLETTSRFTDADAKSKNFTKTTNEYTYEDEFWKLYISCSNSLINSILIENKEGVNLNDIYSINSTENNKKILQKIIGAWYCENNGVLIKITETAFDLSDPEIEDISYKYSLNETDNAVIISLQGESTKPQILKDNLNSLVMKEPAGTFTFKRINQKELKLVQERISSKRAQELEEQEDFDKEFEKIEKEKLILDEKFNNKEVSQAEYQKLSQEICSKLMNFYKL